MAVEKKTVDSGVSALKTEVAAEELSVTFRYDGTEYTVPSPKVWPLEVMEAQEESRTVGALRALLGEVQWAEFRKEPRTVQDLGDILEACFDAVNLNQGK